MTVKTLTRDNAPAEVPNRTLQVVLPVTPHANPKALVLHCSDPRFRKAFRTFIEGDVNTGCLGLRDEDYASIVIPGGISSLSDILALPKQYKVTKEQVELLLEKYPSIETVVLINHEDCAGYELVKSKIGSSFLGRFTSMVDKQKSDLVTVAKDALNLGHIKARFRVFMAKFDNPEHTKVRFEEIVLK